MIKEQDTIGKPKKTQNGIQIRNRAFPYRTWWGAASPILNDTPVVYTTYNRTRIRNVHIYIYIYINTEFLDGNQVIRRKHGILPIWVITVNICLCWIFNYHTSYPMLLLFDNICYVTGPLAWFSLHRLDFWYPFVSQVNFRTLSFVSMSACMEIMEPAVLCSLWIFPTQEFGNFSTSCW